MTLAGFLLFLFFFCVGAYLAHWVINKFFPEPMRMPLLALAGVLLLLALLWAFIPEAANYRLWGR